MTLRVHAVTLIPYTPALTLSGIVYTDAVSNRNGFMTSKPHRKRHGFEVFTRNLSNRLGQTEKFLPRPEVACSLFSFRWTVLVHHLKLSLPILKFSFHSSESMPPSKKLSHQKLVLPGRIQNLCFAFNFSSLLQSVSTKMSTFQDISACCYDMPLGLSRVKYKKAEKAKLNHRSKLWLCNKALYSVRGSPYLPFASQPISRQNK